jgi:hypothetical protein
MTIATYAAAIYALRTARGKYFLGPLFLGMKNNNRPADTIFFPYSLIPLRFRE